MSIADRILAVPDCVTVASVHHTGTWFTLNFLLGHPQIHEVTEMRDLINGAPVTKHGAIHYHLMGDREVNSRGVVEEMDFVDVIDLIDKTQTIIPLRDPMKAIITRQERHPDLSHNFIVDGFTMLATLDAVFLPIDLPMSYGERHQLLCTALCDVGLAPHSYVNDYANKWKPSNTFGEYELKRLYREGDLNSVRSFFPEDYDYLLSRAAEIVPFLKLMGYEDLPWWSEL